MSDFPDNLMPSHLKQEANDVKGNRYVISAADHNKHDEEIRAIEKAIGTPASPTGCSTQSLLAAIVARLNALKNDVILTTSGVVAISGTDLTPTGYIPFPAGWATTLSESIPDASVDDEDVLDPIESLELADVSDLPSEGYVTLINDVSTTPTKVVRTDTLTLLNDSVAFGKVGLDFRFALAPSKNATLTVTGLPAGLTLEHNIISGIPESSSNSTVTVKLTSGSETATVQMLFRIAAGGPTLTVPSSKWMFIGLYPINHPFFTINYTGALKSLTATPLPAGLSLVGNKIIGNAYAPGEASTVITATDVWGDTATATIQLTVRPFRGV
jgi:hypothetical protein